MYIEREIKTQVLKYLHKNKVLLLLGARRTGKTTFLKQLLKQINEPYIYINGEDVIQTSVLSERSIRNYKNLLGNKRLLIIDEAQKIHEIGNILKLMIDSIDNLQIIATGSSAFDLTNKLGEPLTGRKYTFMLYPFSEREWSNVEDIFEKRTNFKERLIFGSYPELVHLKDRDEKIFYLKDLVNSYLLKDVLAFELIKNADKVFNLLRLLAFQIGSEVSYQELALKLGISKNTVQKYLDLLSKVFVIFKVQGYSRNLRKEITKNHRWYFYDNGILNTLKANFNPIDFRDDIGALWENYVISERIKFLHNKMIFSNYYFWRTYDQQEIDWVEEYGGELHGYEIKWNPKRKASVPKAWQKAYPNAGFTVITPANFFEWIEA